MLLKVKNVAKVSTLVLIAGLAVGCATKKDLEQVSAEAQRAAAAADQAQATASEAKTMAADASACCRENTERLDRMFQRSMQK